MFSFYQVEIFIVYISNMKKLGFARMLACIECVGKSRRY